MLRYIKAEYAAAMHIPWRANGGSRGVAHDDMR